MEEIWKDVVGYEELYKVSNLGRIKSLPKRKFTPSVSFFTVERICIPREYKGGYLRVSLSKNKKQKLVFVHRIVAEAFLGVRSDLTVNHKDENKKNNRADNLEYMTRADNVRYGTGIERSAKQRKERTVGGVPVNQYTLEGRFVKRYESGSVAMRENEWSGSSSDIFLCCDRKHHTAYGFIWRRDGDTDTSFTIKKTSKKVLQMSMTGEFIAEYDSIQEASEKCGIQRGHICSCCRGKRRQTGGYVWKYKKEC